jgi:uncharacterized protein (DUF305 family)
MEVVQTSPSKRRIRWLAIAGAAVLSLSIAGCSSEQPVDSNGGAVPVSAEQSQTDELGQPAAEDVVDHDAGKDKPQPYGCPVALTFLRDVAFIDFMVPHHRMGIEMNENEIERGEREEVKDLARKDKETQLREIDIMLKVRERLTGSAEVPPPPPDPKMDMDMERIRTLSGKALDAFYLTELIPHHSPAIEVAHRSMPTLETRAIRKVAREIFEGQVREIAEIEVLRGKFHCDMDE